MIDRRQHIIGKFIPYVFETITVTDTAIGLTVSSTYLQSTPRPKKAWITVETAQMRMRIDGTDPSSSVGHLFNPTAAFVLEGYSQLNNAKFIRVGGTSSVLQVTYYR